MKDLEATLPLVIPTAIGTECTVQKIIHRVQDDKTKSTTTAAKFAWQAAIVKFS